jgi:hypothetical protein
LVQVLITGFYGQGTFSAHRRFSISQLYEGYDFVSIRESERQLNVSDPDRDNLDFSRFEQIAPIDSELIQEPSLGRRIS